MTWNAPIAAGLVAAFTLAGYTDAAMTHWAWDSGLSHEHIAWVRILYTLIGPASLYLTQTAATMLYGTAVWVLRANRAALAVAAIAPTMRICVVGWNLTRDAFAGL